MHPARAALAIVLPLALCAGVLVGCVVGPDYAGPPPVAHASLDRPTFVRAGNSETPGPPPARWWEPIGDPQLNELIEAALAHSPSLESAEARVRSARAQVLLADSRYLPAGGVAASWLRARIPTGTIAGSGGASAGSPAIGDSAGSALPDPLELDVFSANFDAAWEFDLFGATRRGSQAARAAAEGAAASFEDAQVQLVAQVARAYLDLRAAQAHEALAERTIALRNQTVSLTAERLQRGTVARVDLDREQSALRQARGQRPARLASVEQQIDQLAILTGREPGALDERLAFAGVAAPPVPQPPQTVPVGTPAEWLRRRPDIRAAERRLAVRTADIGRNVAGYFPTVSLLGLFGNTASSPGGLAGGTPLSLVAPTLTWNFFSIPRVRANVRSAEADRDQAFAEYRQAVLQALGDANGALARFGRDREALAEWEAARDAAVNAARLTRERYEAGTASLIDVLDTERERAAAEDQLVTAQTDLTVAYVSLQKSLGLGWGAAPPPRFSGVTATTSTRSCCR